MDNTRLRVMQARVKLKGCGYHSFPTAAFCKKYGHQHTPKLDKIINGLQEDQEITIQIEEYVDHLVSGILDEEKV